MKTRLLLALSALVGFLTTSCNITETITFSEDGSGVMVMEADGSQLMAQAKGKLGDKKERIDSVFTFRDFYKGKEDSIAKLPAEEQQRIKAFEKMECHMVMDTETGEFTMTFNNKFKNAKELVNMMNGVGAAGGAVSNKMGGKNPSDMGMGSENPDISYFYDGKKFKKTVKQSQPEEEEDPETAQLMQQIYQSFEGSTYTVTYNFPKKVKSVSNKTATISTDKKSVTAVYDFVEYMEKPKSMDLEVVFE